MPDEVRTIGWGERMGSSIKGIAVGFVLFLASFPLLFWNEGRAVKTAQGLEEGAKAVISVPPGKVDGANENRLVHTSAEATTTETLADDLFPAVSARALHLARDVEIYQWKETKDEKRKKNTGGSETVETTYHYQKTWTGEPINSDGFHSISAEYQRLKPVNTGTLPCPAKEWWAGRVTLGAFALPDEMVRRIGAAEKLEVQDKPEATSATVSGQKPKVSKGGYYFGKDPATAEIGDARVSFRIIKPQTVSVLGQQTGDTLRAYATKAGTTILRVERGNLSAEQMFAAAQAENTLATWVLRLVGFIIMFIGLKLLFEPLGVMADVLPFLGDMLRLGTGLVAFLIAVVLSLLTIAIAWLVYRPLIGVPLLVVSVGLLVWLKVMGAKKKAALAVGAAGGAPPAK